DTSFKQIAAEAFGIGLDNVKMTRGDSSNAPYSGGAGGSKTLYTVGLAVQKAAEDARNQVFAIASELLESDVSDLEIVDGLVRVKGVPERGVTLQKIASMTMGPG